MRIPVSQISEDGWTRKLEIPLGSLSRVVEAHGPQAGTLRADVTLKNHRGCIGMSGRIQADLRLACHLCLDRGPVAVDAALELMVVPTATWRAGPSDSAHPEVQIAAADLDVSFYEGEELDLTQVLEDELLIAAPDSLGEEDEDGRCVHCGREVAAMLKPKHEPDAFHPFRELADRLGKEAAKPDSKE